MDVLYFDNAASSWPKPPAVLQAMAECLQEYAANPGRGSHQLAVKASRVLFDTRRHAAKLFGARNPNDISFTLNATHALNAAIKGFCSRETTLFQPVLNITQCADRLNI